MPRITNYEVDSEVTSTDKLIGTDTGGGTKNYTLSAIATHYRDTNAISTITSFPYKLDLTGSLETGEIQLNSSSWASVTSATLSKYVFGNESDSMANALGILPGRDVIIAQSDDQNIYGIYTAGTLAAVGGSDNYTLALTYKSHYGSPSDGKVYSMNCMDTDGEFTGSIKITKNLRRTVTTVTHSSNTHTCDLSQNDNFIINANAATNTIAMTIAEENVGQSGNIIIKNASSGTVSFAALPSYMYTPSGATVNFVTGNSKIAVVSYIVLEYDSGGNHKVLVNYIGDFS